MSKRVFILLAILMLLASVLVGCGATPEPTKAPEPTAAVSEPAAEPATAALKITGKVAKEIGWTEEEVRAMETMDVEATNKQGETSTYTGVSMNKLLEMASPASDATTLVFVADDGYTAEVALPDMQACGDCIVSFRDQGGFSTVLPGLPSSVQVKGVIEIQVK
jgi:hypothetical protein